ncbi:MAG: prephenate dehydratase [Candidatus Omnitrophica bacterium]|nr:prephenate dehydratase [Candidatus Omnitrophota bacterium]
MKEKKLEILRREIDHLDKKIIQLLNQRTEVALEIGEIKDKKGISVYAPQREEDIYRRIIKLNKGPLREKTVKAVYREIMSGTLSLQKEMRIAYLGPAATFTHLAALKKFGSSVEYLNSSNIDGIFKLVEKGEADYGVVPIENSIEGAVNYTLDMFIDFDIKICSEIFLKISHSFLSNFPLPEIKRVYSNPQVFGQCRGWLNRNLPNAELIEVSSTTKAAEIATGEKYSGAIANELAAQIYNLKIVKKDIQDSLHNITRFLVIGKNEVSKTGKDKTSIVFSLKDKVGALYETLLPFKKQGINLTKIESRPSKKRAWEYYFFVDLEGHSEDKKVKKVLTELNKKCIYLKILGAYPKSGL